MHICSTFLRTVLPQSTEKRLQPKWENGRFSSKTLAFPPLTAKHHLFGTSSYSAASTNQTTYYCSLSNFSSKTASGIQHVLRAQGYKNQSCSDSSSMILAMQYLGFVPLKRNRFTATCGHSFKLQAADKSVQATMHYSINYTNRMIFPLLFMWIY